MPGFGQLITVPNATNVASVMDAQPEVLLTGVESLDHASVQKGDGCYVNEHGLGFTPRGNARHEWDLVFAGTGRTGSTEWFPKFTGATSSSRS
jgi:hypothetical protein